MLPESILSVYNLFHPPSIPVLSSISISLTSNKASTMASKPSSFFSSLLRLLVPVLLLSSPAAAHNITQILNQFTGFSDLNRLLTQTQLAGEINYKKTLTVLAVNNAVLSSISRHPPEVLKKILMLHVVLDYYDKEKLQQLPHRSAILTTLLQSTGLAAGAEGFLNATATPSGRVAFRSAVPGSPLGADLVKVVAAQPYNISVLQISNVIVPPGFIAAPTPSPMPISPSPSTAAAPAPVEPPVAGGRLQPPMVPPPVAGGPLQPPMVPPPVAGGPLQPPMVSPPVAGGPLQPPMVSPPAPVTGVPPQMNGADAPSTPPEQGSDSASAHPPAANAGLAFLTLAMFLGAI